VRISLIGDSQAGKSTLAIHLALALHKVRKWSAPPLLLSSEPSLAATPYSIDHRRTRSISGAVRWLNSASKCVAVVDTVTEFYTTALDAWRDQAAEGRERAGLPRQLRLSPEVWGIINRKYQGLFRAAFASGLDLIEVHRRGQVFVSDSDFGLIEGEGTKARGQSEAGGCCDLLVVLDGGLRSRRQTTGRRSLTVVSDASGRCVGRSLELPDLRSEKDRQGLQKAVESLLFPSLKDLVKWGDEDRREWQDLSEPADTFSEAFEAAQRAEADLVGSQVSALLAISGLAGQKAEAVQRRTELLLKFFGVPKTDAFDQVPSGKLREAFTRFEQALRLPSGSEEIAL
jgi:hypothetical protein